MKTTAITGTPSTTDVRRRRLRSGESEAFADYLSAADTSSVGNAGVAGGVVGIGALLGIQVVEDVAERGYEVTRRHGERLLDRLDLLRLDLLAGHVPIERLTGLAQMIHAEQRRSGDAVLDGVLADIELRIEVELAKLSRPRTPSVQPRRAPVAE